MWFWREKFVLAFQNKACHPHMPKGLIELVIWPCSPLPSLPSLPDWNWSHSFGENWIWEKRRRPKQPWLLSVCLHFNTGLFRGLIQIFWVVIKIKSHLLMSLTYRWHYIITIWICCCVFNVLFSVRKGCVNQFENTTGHQNLTVWVDINGNYLCLDVFGSNFIPFSFGWINEMSRLHHNYLDNICVISTW